MTTAYLAPTEELPLDNKHRWLVFASKPGRPSARIDSALRSLGLYPWGTQESQKRIGANEVAYTTMVEATIAGVTPVKIAQKLGVNKLTLGMDTIPWSIEMWVDAQELASKTPVPVDFIREYERLNPGTYHGALAAWFGSPVPTMKEVSSKLKEKGFEVIVDESMKGSTTGNNKFFYIGTKDKNPSLRELRDIIHADALYINRYPFEDATTLRDLGGAKIALEQGLRDFSKSTANAANAIVDLVTGAVDAINTLSKVGTFLLYSIPVLLVGGLGYWGYTKYKEAQ